MQVIKRTNHSQTNPKSRELQTKTHHTNWTRNLDVLQSTGMKLEFHYMWIMTILSKTKNCIDTKLSMSNLICCDPPFQLGLSSYSYQIHSPPLLLWFAPWQVCHCASLLHRCSHFHLESHPGEAIVLEASVGDQLQKIWVTVHILAFCNPKITSILAAQAELTQCNSPIHK